MTIRRHDSVEITIEDDYKIRHLLARREKQLARMITEARAWMESERACNKMFNELLNRFPEEQRAIDGEDAAGIIPYR